MAGQAQTVAAREAAEMLGISVPTLYAYVSRGLLRSELGAEGARARRYRLEEIEALRARKEYRREPARAAGAALDFGMPVLDSAITLIEDGRLFYRGYDVAGLVQAHSFEEVAALLWTGEFAAGALFENAGSTAPRSIGKPADNLAGPIELYQATLALAASDDLAAHQYTPGAVARTGARILLLLTQATIQASGDQMADRSIAVTLQRAWAPEHAEAAALLSAALILCADHELNVSAFTARCVASAGATPYAVVIAALSALGGYKHGGHTAQTAALLAAAVSGVRPTVAGYLRGGATIPGFGHVLYPEGDPRAQHMLALLGQYDPNAACVQTANELCAAVYDALGLHPTIDFALAALAAALDAPPHSPLALFALGRTAGWIAHAGEQYALDQLIRPRARYVGEKVRE